MLLCYARLDRPCYARLVSTESITPELSIDPGILLDAELPSSPQPRWGSPASMIRKIAAKYPELSQGDIAKRVGCSPQNVSEVLAKFLADTSPEYLDDYQANKPAVFEALQYRTLASITQEDITNSSFMQRVTAAAILQDKISLMRGQPTAIHAHLLVDVLDMLRVREQE